MSTSLFYHGWGIKHHLVRRLEYTEGVIIAHLEKNPEHRRCASCRSPFVTVCGTKPGRIWRTLLIGLRRVFLALVPRILICQECGARLQEPIEFAEPRKSYCKRLAAYATDLAKLLPISRVSHHTGLHQDIIKDLVKKDLAKKQHKIQLRHLKNLAIDEIYVSKKRKPKWLSIVLDLETGRIVFVGDGRAEESIRPFFKRLKRAKACIEAVAMDMWDPYRNVVSESYEDAVIVFDHFHVVRLMNKAVDKVRRREVARAKAEDDDAGSKVIKGTRYLLLKRPEKLDDEGKERLDAVLALNDNLNRTYILSEDLRTLWDHEDKESAEEHLLEWAEEALSTHLKPLITMANTLLQHKDRILAYYDVAISTGRLEGLNTSLKLLTRKARGYRDRAFLKLRILFHHETRYALSGV